MSGSANPPVVLIVDDSEPTLEIIGRNLTANGYSIMRATNVEEALERLAETQPDLVVTDIKMPRVSGLDLVRHVRENLKDTEVVAITGYPNVDGAVTAMKHGASDYLSKPFTSEELLAVVRQALERRDARKASEPVATVPSPARHGLLGDSAEMRDVFDKIERASRAKATVLITGESGTGKELVARAIHYQSERAAAPFVAVNCGAIPGELLESELFGHVRGAFTGATETRAGFFLTADRGTIFLDEIAETSPAMQVKLLRVLQDREVTMVGANRSQRVDVRVIAATNKDLAKMVGASTFRDDLYFRINVVTIELAPLRDRAGDIPLLASHFATKFAGEQERPTPTFSDRALALLRGYAWPGNVRELENTVQRAVVMSDTDVIDVPDLPGFMRYHAGDEGDGTQLSLAEVEARHIRRVLDHAGGNKTRAAEILGIDRKTLRAKLNGGT